MIEENSDRKIAVIFATDVVGYSKAIENNETQTLKNLKECRNILVNRKTGRASGCPPLDRPGVAAA